MPKIALSIIISYIVGSIPFAYLLGRIFKSIDIRKHGSGNIGATNAFRVLGPAFGILALMLDISKGIFCTTLLADYLGISVIAASWHLILRIILGLIAVAGHNWTIFLKFKGGKGVATSLGVILGLATIIPVLKIVLSLASLTWVVIFIFSGIISLSSIIAAVFLPLFLALFHAPLELLILSIILAIFIVFRHKANISRLLRKEEYRFDILGKIRKGFSGK